MNELTQHIVSQSLVVVEMILYVVGIIVTSRAKGNILYRTGLLFFVLRLIARIIVLLPALTNLTDFISHPTISYLSAILSSVGLIALVTGVFLHLKRSGEAKQVNT